MRKLRRRLVEVIVVLLITFTLAEVSFRIYAYVRPSGIFYSGSSDRFRGMPFAQDWEGFHLNSHGFKDLEFSREKAAGQERIVALGDSFTFGIVPYQHNFLTLLEETLNNKGRKTEIINMGVPRTGPDAYLALLQNEALPLKPDMVLVSFFVGNDFTDVDEAPRPWYSYSYLFSYLKFLRDMGREIQQGVLSNQYEDAAPYFTEEYFLDLERDRSWFYVKDNPAFEANLIKVVAALRTMKELCDSKGIRFAVVMIPDELQVNRSLQSNVMHAQPATSENRFNFRLPNWLLTQRLDALNIENLDLLDQFRRETKDVSLYKPRESHWNIAGNKLAARLIDEHLFGDSTDAGSNIDGASSVEAFLDNAGCGWIDGWAWNSARSDDSLHIELMDGEARVASFTADEFRQDLAEAKKGDGYHSFSYPVPPQFHDGKAHTVHLRVAGMESDLVHSPIVIQCGNF